MPSMRLSHIAFPVPDLAEACRFYGRLLGVDEVRLSKIEAIGVTNAFFVVGDRVYLELIATPDGGPMRVFKDVVEHGQQIMCFETDDIPGTVAQLRDDGLGDYVVELPQHPKVPEVPFDRAWVYRGARGDFSMEIMPAGGLSAMYETAPVVRIEDL